VKVTGFMLSGEFDKYLHICVVNGLSRLGPDPNNYNWNKYRRLFNQAVKYEKVGDIVSAMDIYDFIMDNYIPFGVEYYERPANICEKLGEREAALHLYRLALLNHIMCEDKDTRDLVWDVFKPRIERLLKMLGREDEPTLYFE